VFRIPFREYDPVGSDIVDALMQQPTGLTHANLLDLPIVRARNLRNLGFKLGRLKRWNPPGRMMPGSIIEKDDSGRWRIEDQRKATEYTTRQKTLFDREHSAIRDYMLRHLAQALASISSYFRYSEDLLSFDIINHVISCEIDQQTFNRLRRRYELSLGQLHRTSRLPPIICRSSRNVQEEFVRGLADVIGSFDRWLDLWRVQFSFLENEMFCIDFCRLFQMDLGIPVHYIEWNEVYMNRGNRDILLKIWTTNAAQLADSRVFYNNVKQTEFLANLDSTRTEIGDSGRPNMFNRCPRNPARLPKYTARCIRCGCTQI